jgi:hypothetical protein
VPRRPVFAFRRALIATHRWLGVALCLLFLVWFPSGIGMMYWSYPEVTDQSRRERSPNLDPATIRLSPREAYIALDSSDPPTAILLGSYDGRPVYRFAFDRGESLVYADTGETGGAVSPALMRRVAAMWSGQPPDAARAEVVEEVDQWTLQLPFEELQPLWRYSWKSGDRVYVSEATGEVVQHTTTASRLGAYLGPIPHWLYFTPLRRHGSLWSAIVIWSSGIATVTAILGLAIGAWVYSPRKRYRPSRPTSIPYQGQKRWHMLLGLFFGVGAVTWAFSGMLSMDPFPVNSGVATRGGAAGLSRALRDRPVPAVFAARHPREAISMVGSIPVKELELITLVGDPVYLATLADASTRIVPVRGETHEAIDSARLRDLVTRAAPAAGVAEMRAVDSYDAYYLDRRRKQPLPVLLVRLNDREGTRYYIDPKTGQIVGGYSSRRWFTRWMYHGLHSLNFPWLYNARPLWDVVVITFMVGGTALCVTSVVLAWRVIGRRLRDDLL